MSPLNLTSERWLRLVQDARLAAAMPHFDPADLRTRADRMREVPSPGDGHVRCLTSAFRWACLWFANGNALSRVEAAPALEILCDHVARACAPTSPPPEAAAAAVPPPSPPLAEPSEPAWLKRADAGRG